MKGEKSSRVGGRCDAGATRVLHPSLLKLGFFFRPCHVLTASELVCEGSVSRCGRERPAKRTGKTLLVHTANIQGPNRGPFSSQTRRKQFPRLSSFAEIYSKCPSHLASFRGTFDRPLLRDESSSGDGTHALIAWSCGEDRAGTRMDQDHRSSRVVIFALLACLHYRCDDRTRGGI